MRDVLWKSMLVSSLVACGSVDDQGTAARDAGNDASQTPDGASASGGTSSGGASATGGTSSSVGGSGAMAGAGTGCKVGGVVYPNGSTDIQDPFSCNKCSCSNGQLGCTKIACPNPCPAGTAPSMQCAQCGPVDNCEVVEHGCLPTCTQGGCSGGGACIEGVCRMLCG